jgi:ribosomal-protein-alanine N-acetyltransferase
VNPPVVLRCNDSVSLRAPEPLDAEAVARHGNDWKVWINLRDTMPHPYSVADATRWLERIQHQDPRINFIIDLVGQAVGTIGLVIGTDVERCTAEVGYWVGAEHCGRGIATSALIRITRYAFEDLGLLRVFAKVKAANVGSFRVLEKAAFTREGLMRNACIKDGKVMDMALYAKVCGPKS